MLIRFDTFGEAFRVQLFARVTFVERSRRAKWNIFENPL